MILRVNLRLNLFNFFMFIRNRIILNGFIKLSNKTQYSRSIDSNCIQIRIIS